MNQRVFDLPVRAVKVSEDQKRFFDLDCDVQGFVAGRGAGKTVIGCLKMLYTVNPGDSWCAVAPCEDLTEQCMWPMFLETAGRLGVLRETCVGRLRHAIVATQFGGEANVWFKSADRSDRLCGLGLAGAWLDDASSMESGAYTSLIPCLRRMTSQGPRVGRCLMTFTPVPPIVNPETGGKCPYWTFCAFHEEFDESSHSAVATQYCQRFWKPHRFAQVVHARSEDNPFLPPEFFEIVKSLCSHEEREAELSGKWPE